MNHIVLKKGKDSTAELYINGEEIEKVINFSYNKKSTGADTVTFEIIANNFEIEGEN